MELYADRLDAYAISARIGTGLDDLRAAAFRLGKVIRVYAKEPGKEPDLKQPFTSHAGCTLLQFAQHVHKDFLALKFARLWGPSARFPGQTIQKDHVLMDRDVVELHL